MENINFQPVFDYIDGVKQELKQEITSELGSKIEAVQKSVDAIAVGFKNNDEKITIQEGKTERLEHWVIEASDKVKVPYKP